LSFGLASRETNGKIMKTKTAIIYYSATGGTYGLALALAEGAYEADGDVRLRKVRELAPEATIASNAGWSAHRLETQNVLEASLEDLEWADAIMFGTPTRFGLPSAQLKQFIDACSPLWEAGKLVNKVVSSFTSAATAHGGQEATVLSLNTAFYHWGCLIVPPGYTDAAQFAAGTPYGASFTSDNGTIPPDEVALAAARHQGRRTVQVARQFLAGAERYSA